MRKPQKQWLKYDVDDNAFHGVTSDGRKIRVSIAHMNDSLMEYGIYVWELCGFSRQLVTMIARYPKAIVGILDPDVWQSCMMEFEDVVYEDIEV